RKVLEQKFSGKRSNRLERRKVNTCNLPSSLSSFDEGKRSNRFERRKVNTCNLPRYMPHCDEQPVARRSCFDEGRSITR
ncbi:MAG: hypothetical protein IJR61_02305, partial [Clostridia bacterium]|nr:hypothetical protein [Clostridia bacterium]